MSDDLTNVPEVVRKQAEEALRLFNTAAQAATNAGQPLGGEATKTEEPAEAKPAEVETTDAAPTEATEEAAPTETKEPAPAKEAAPVPATLRDVATEEMTKEQRYKIMEGIQKAAGRDLSRAQAEARALREELAALQARLASAPAAAPVQKEVSSAADPALREQVAEAFGSENVEKFFQLMRQEGFVAKQDLDAVRGEVGNVARTVVQSAQERFQSTMEDLAPGWATINQDPKFIEYMNEEEGRTGLSRLEFAKRHLERLDAHRLAQYFVDFGASVAPVEATATPQTPKLDKKKFAAPPSTPAVGKEPTEKTNTQTVKASDMARFAREVIIGKYGGNEKALNKKDAETWNAYLSAQREGRVVEDK